jgi:nitronate monooxygenase
MSLATLLESLPIPVIQAPMLGVSSPEMALAVSRAGGVGSLAGAGWGASEIAAAVGDLKSRTDAPFAVNLLMTRPADPDAATVAQALGRLAPWYEALDEPLPARPNDFAPDFVSQLEAMRRAAPPVASFAFDVLAPAQVEALQAAGTYVVGTATTVAEARAWAAAGADGICAQGFEAGGHRGHFLGEPQASLVGTMALTATIRAAVDLPVIAAGGIMDGAGIAAALALGASAAQMGTAFLLAEQATTNPPWRRALAAAPDDPTRLTRAITGRHARGVENRFMREMRAVEDEVPAYPVQNRLTQALRAAAVRAGDPDVLSLWAGQGVKLAAPGEAGEMVRRWWDEARAASRALAARTGA